MTNTEGWTGSAEQQAKALARQVSDWTKELARLADMIAAAKGASYAVVMISNTQGGYEDVNPQLVLEDALRIVPYGWPPGFNFEVLNLASA